MESKEEELKKRVKEELLKLEEKILAMDPGTAHKAIGLFYPIMDKLGKIGFKAEKDFKDGIRKMNARDFSSASRYFENAFGVSIKIRNSNIAASALEIQVRCLLNIDNASIELTCDKAKMALKIYEEIGGREGSEGMARVEKLIQEIKQKEKK